MLEQSQPFENLGIIQHFSVVESLLEVTKEKNDLISSNKGVFHQVNIVQLKATNQTKHDLISDIVN